MVGRSALFGCGFRQKNSIADRGYTLFTSQTTCAVHTTNCPMAESQRLDPASAVVANTLASRGAGDAKRVQTERLQRILNDLPAHFSDTAEVRGNRPIDLHPMIEMIPEGGAVCGLKGMTCVIGGASRGIGQGMAVRFAKSGANVCVLGRSDGMIETGPGTLSAVVKQIDFVGGKGLAVQCDLRLADQVSPVDQSSKPAQSLSRASL